MGIKNVIMTIIRRVADPGDYNRGLTNALKVDPVPSHQATDLMLIMPHIKATGVLVHTPVTHGHIVSIVATPSRRTTEKEVVELFKAHPRIRVVRIADGFLGNASLFKYARDLGNLRGDMYEIAVFEETVKVFEDQIIYTINIPQEAVVTPETMDAIRATMEMQRDRLEAVSLTNKYLKLGAKNVRD
jgi:glyceraldehyde-3-phosphate dehydrogenase (NAD(P))